MFKINHNLYADANSCVRVSHLKSELFCSNIGVRQGKNLSPLLFSLFLNDLTKFIAHAYNGLIYLTCLKFCSEMMKLKFFQAVYTTVC